MHVRGESNRKEKNAAKLKRKQGKKNGKDKRKCRVLGKSSKGCYGNISMEVITL